MRVVTALLLGLLIVLPGQVTFGAAPQTSIQHLVVIMQENHTFDNYFGTFPAANGLQNAPPSVKPFHIAGPITDMCHSWKCAHLAYDKGKMDKFLEAEGSNQTFGYYDERDIPYYWSLAKNYTLFDNYFSSVMGSSLPNHLYLVAGRAGGLRGGIPQPLPVLQIKSVFDGLEAKHISWRYYAPYLLGNENPLILLSSIAGNQTRISHIKSTENFLNDFGNGDFAQITWIMPREYEGEHPPYDINVGERWVQSIITTIQSSQYWSSTAILLTWDDYGGWYDHVAPTQVDRAGYGFRVPLILVSPFAKHGYIDRTLSDHTSILRFIETVFGLDTVARRDANAYDLMSSLRPGDLSTDETYTVEGNPTFTTFGAINLTNTTYRNNLPSPQQGIAYAVVHNALNQTVAIGISFVSARAQERADALIALPTLPSGNYSIHVFTASSRGIVISRVTETVVVVP